MTDSNVANARKALKEATQALALALAQRQKLREAERKRVAQEKKLSAQKARADAMQEKKHQKAARAEEARRQRQAAQELREAQRKRATQEKQTAQELRQRLRTERAEEAKRQKQAAQELRQRQRDARMRSAETLREVMAERAATWKRVAQPAIAVRKRMQLEKNNPTYAKKYPDYVSYCRFTYACTKALIAKLCTYRHDDTQPHVFNPSDPRMDWRNYLPEEQRAALRERWAAMKFSGIHKPERSYPPLPAPAGLAQQTQNPTETGVLVDNPA